MEPYWEHHKGKFYIASALIDSASEAIFISEWLFKLLGYPARNVSAKVSVLNNGISARCNKICSITPSSRFDSTVRIEAL